MFAGSLVLAAIAIASHAVRSAPSRHRVPVDSSHRSQRSGTGDPPLGTQTRARRPDRVSWRSRVPGGLVDAWTRGSRLACQSRREASLGADPDRRSRPRDRAGRGAAAHGVEVRRLQARVRSVHRRPHLRRRGRAARRPAAGASSGSDPAAASGRFPRALAEPQLRLAGQCRVPRALWSGALWAGA